MNVVPLSASIARPQEGGSSFPLGHRLFRLGFSVCWAIFAAWTPPPLRIWRVAVLKAWGAKMSWRASVYGSARIWFPPHLLMEEFSCLGPGVNCYNMAPVKLSKYSVVSQGAFLCAGSHDVGDRYFQLIVKPITVEAHAWIAADAFVGPGICIGEGAILGARGVAFQDLEPWTIYLGNPAVLIRRRPRKEDG